MMAGSVGKIDLPPQDLQFVRQTFAKAYPHLKVVVFGSRVTGRAKRYSDLDLCLFNEERLGLAALTALQETFRESALPIRVDLVEWITLSADFKNIISHDGVDLFSFADDNSLDLSRETD